MKMVLQQQQRLRMQVATEDSTEKSEISEYAVVRGLLKAVGIPGLYRGFGTVITRAVPTRIIFLTALETTKVAAFKMVEPFKLSDPTKAAIANGRAGMTTSLFSQGVFVPNDVDEFEKEDNLSEALTYALNLTPPDPTVQHPKPAPTKQDHFVEKDDLMLFRKSNWQNLHV